MKIIAVSASMSDSSSSTALGERILRGITRLGSDQGQQVEVGVVSLRELAHDLVDQTLTGVPTPAVDEAFTAVRSADAVVAITPIYNAAPVGLFTLFWQLFPDQGLRDVPVLLAGTGGTARHSLVLDSQVRPLIAYLKGIALPTTVFAATEDWGGIGGAGSLATRTERGAEELLTLAYSIGGGIRRAERADDVRIPHTLGEPAERVVDEFDPAGITPFEELLRAG